MSEPRPQPRSRRVLITGGSSGIGRATVERFARGGDQVWFTYRTGQQRALATVAELSAHGWDVEAFEFDQGNWSSHECLVQQLPGQVDVLVNNAAVGSKSIEQYVPGPDRRREAAFLWINSVGPLWLIRQLLPGMLDQGHGTIVNVSSVGGGVAAFPGFEAADGMSKAALAYLTKHLAAELAHQPVGVFAICPGAVDTTMLQQSTLAGLPEQRRRDLEARLPQGRLIQPAEIAEVVWWLASDEAQVLHGAVIDASMGLGSHPGLLTGWAEEDARATLRGE
ncbi:MAG TPA: SDR family oxidoreductase [Pseudonocardiaceae bacterium]